MKECRKCGVELIVGENWWPSYAKTCNYICIPCAKAYKRQPNRIVTCKSCGEEKEHQAKGLCKKCYDWQWSQEHKEEKAACSRRWNAEHKEERAAYGRQYYQENQEKYCKRSRQHYRENREKFREYGRQRRARLVNATTGPIDEQAVYNLYDNTCLYCGSKEGDLTIDHVVPLNGGGSHCQENLVVACRSCNCSKKDKLLEEWLQIRPDLQAWVM